MKSSLYKITERKNVLQTILWLSTFLLLMLVIAAVRYKLGGQYLPVGVRVDDSSVRGVWLISPLGTAQALTKAEGLSGYFCPLDNHSGPVACVAVEGVRDIHDGAVTILLGESLQGADAHAATRVETAGVTLPEMVPRSSTLFTLPKCRSVMAQLPRRTINWAGDTALALFSVTLTLVITGIGVWLFRIARWSDFPNFTSGVVPRTVTSSIAEGFLRLTALLYMGQHAYLCFSRAMRTKDAMAASGVVIVAVLLAGVIRHCFRQPSSGLKVCLDKRFSMRMVGLVLCLLALRIGVSGRLPWAQAGDYATYLKLGTQIRDGNWAALNNGLYLNLSMAQRTLFTGFPASLFGEHASIATFWTNSIAVAVVGVWVFRMVARRFGRSAAVAAACIYALHPDVLYGGHLCRHDIPGLLAILSTCVLWELLYRELSGGICLANLGRVSVLGVLCGVSMAFAELSRSLMVFCGLAAMAVICHDVLRRRLRLFTASLSIGFLAVILSIATLLVCNAQQEISHRAGPFNSAGFATLLNSVETGAGFSWRNLAPWDIYYINAVSRDSILEFTLRKLLFEKVQKFPEYSTFVVAKSAEMAGIYGILEKTGAVIPGDQFPLLYTVPWVSVKLFFADFVYFVLLAFGLLRCVCLSRFPLIGQERWLVLFSFSLIGIMVLLGEPSQQYDYFLAVPLAVNLGVIAGLRGCPARLKPAPIVSDALNQLLPAATGLAILWGAAYGLSEYLRHNERFTFARPLEMAVSEGARLVEDRAAIALVPEPGFSGSEVVRGQIWFLKRDLRSPEIRFLISGDQRRLGILFDRARWWDLNLRYRVLVDGSEVCSGNVSDLAVARQVSAAVSSESDRVCLQVELLGDFGSLEDLESPASLAVEYIY